MEVCTKCFSKKESRNEKLASKGDAFGEDIIRNKKILSGNLLSNGDSICCEITWDRIKTLLNIEESKGFHLLKRLVVLYELEILKGIKYEGLKYLSEKMEIRVLNPGDSIYEMGIKSSHIFLIKHGLIKIINQDAKYIKLASGQLFGEFCLFEEENDFESAEAIENTTIFCIPVADFTKVVSRNTLSYLIENWKVNNDVRSSEEFFHLTDKFLPSETKFIHNKKNIYSVKALPIMSNTSSHHIDEISNRSIFFEHPFICKPIKIIKTESYTYLLESYCPIVSLLKFKEDNVFPPQILKQTIGSISLVLDALHRQNLSCKVLTLDNIGFDRNGQIKVKLNEKAFITNFSFNLNELHYLSPESIKGFRYQKESDYWALGVILFFLIYDRFPFGNQNSSPLEVMEEILTKHVQLKARQTISKENNLINYLLQRELSKRLSTLSDIKSDNLFTDFDWTALYSLNESEVYVPTLPFASELIEKQVEFIKFQFY